MINKLLRLGWYEWLVALLMGAPVKINGRTYRLWSHTGNERRVLDKSLFGFDFSKWQGAIDFLRVFAYGAKFLILRASYGLVTDERFHEYMQTAPQYFEGRLSVYGYYYPHLPPKDQAYKLIETIAPYKSKIRRVYGDFEFSGSGAYESPANWKIYLETIIAAGYQVGVYTRKTWWDSRVGSLASWFGQFPLWAAQYNTSLTMIPLGWTKAALWQSGTPAIGAQVGTQSLEVDYDIADDGFYQSEYSGQIPPPPDGGSMKKYRVVWPNGVSRRTAPTTSNSSTSLPPYQYDAVVDVVQDGIPDQTYPTDANKRWVKFADGYYGASDYPDGSGPKVRMIDVTPTEPPPPAETPTIEIVYDPSEVTVVLKPQ